MDVTSLVRPRPVVLPAAVLMAMAAWMLVLPISPAAAATQTFVYTGATQDWPVPSGVTFATFDVFGAQGGSNGGFGGEATATIAVVPGEVLQINVGGTAASSGTGGFGGGGTGGISHLQAVIGGGGG